MRVALLGGGTLCLDPSAMFTELEARGVKFDMQETQEV